MSHIEPREYSQNSLNIIHQWQINGIGNAKYIPQITPDNNYLSHPPCSYYLLFGFNQIFGFKYYFIFNAILVFISTICIYLTISLLTLKKARSEFSFFGAIGGLLYLTSYPILEFQFFNFHPDIFILTVLIAVQYLFLKLTMKERYRSIKYIALFSILLLLLNYSSWFGVVFTLIICLIGLFNMRKSYKLIPFILIAILITSFSILLTYSQYAVVGGWKNVLYYFKDTYWRESPLSGHLRQTTIQILWQIFRQLHILIFALLGLIIYSFLTRKRKFLFTKNGYRYLIISIVPVLIYSILLIQYFQNSFASLYFIPPIIVTTSIWLEKLFHHRENKTKLYLVVGSIVIMHLWMVIVNA